MPSAAILPPSLAIPRSSNRSLSSCWAFTGPNIFFPFSIASSSLAAASDLASVATIRMGGGPRTYPGGVSKWQWKRMQAKKSKQLLKARLCRERQLYEMRKRAELKAAISELERPWEVVGRAPVLFSISADEQIKALADRFQRPSGFDMWSEGDGPRLFCSPDNITSARFFPKGAVHSVKPYGVVAGELTDGGEEREKVMRNDDWITTGACGMGKGRRTRVLPGSRSMESERSVSVEEENGDAVGNLGYYHSDSELVVASSRKAEDEMAGRLGRYGRNHGSHRSDSDLAINGSRMNRDNMVGNFGRRGGRDRSWDSRGSDSELPDAGSRVDRQQKFGSFGWRDGGGGRSSYQDSYKSHWKSAFNGSSMERDKIASNFGRRGRGDRNQGSAESHTEFTASGSRMQSHEIAGGFDRRRGRGGRGGNRGYYRSYSELEKDENEGGVRKRDDRGGNRNVMAGGFDRRGGCGGRGGNRGSYKSYSQLAVTGSRMERDEIAGGFGTWNAMASGFDRHRGRGGRGGNCGYYRSYSELDKDDNEGGVRKRDDCGGKRNAMAGRFDRRGGRGGRGGNRGSYRSYSELAVTGSRMERDEIAGGFGTRGVRCGNRNSYGSNSELDMADSRKGRVEMAGSRDRDYSYGGKVSLRPTTELRLEDGGEVRRELKWSGGKNDGSGLIVGGEANSNR